MYIQTRKRQAADKAAKGITSGGGSASASVDGEEAEDLDGERKDVDWESVDVVGGCLKMGLA
jgi:hypothetical protein